MNISNLQYSNLSVHYNSETDYIQCFYNDEWIDCIKANAKTLKIYNYGTERTPTIEKLNSIGTLTRNSDNITYTLSTEYSAVGVKIDLTNYSKVIFEGKINSLNSDFGHVTVTPNIVTNSNWKSYAKTYKELSTNTETYELNVSELSGEYYVCFGGSNRTVTCYRLFIQ